MLGADRFQCSSEVLEIKKNFNLVLSLLHILGTNSAGKNFSSPSSSLFKGIGEVKSRNIITESDNNRSNNADLQA